MFVSGKDRLIDPGASQKAIASDINRRRFPEEARRCLDLLDKFFDGTITYSELSQEMERMRKRQTELIID